MPDPRRNVEREVLDCLIALEKASPHQIAYVRDMISVKYTQRTLEALHKAGRVYIIDWIHYGGRGPWTKIYALGNEPDERKPKPLSSAVRTKAWRARIDTWITPP